MLRIAGVLSLLLLIVSPIHAVMPQYENRVEPPQQEYSPFIDQHFPTRVLFGDTHLHTSWSADAGMIGTTVPRKMPIVSSGVRR